MKVEGGQPKIRKGKHTATLLEEVTEMVWHKTPIKMYAISEPTIKELTAGYNSIHLVCFGVCAGAAVAFSIAWGQTEMIPLRYVYGGLFWGTLVGTLVFGIAGGLKLYEAHNCKKDLEKQSVPLAPPMPPNSTMQR